MELQNFFSWIQEEERALCPWLMLGKGPTFRKRQEFDLSEFKTIALNHVIREQKVDVLHAIDIEVIERCADVLDANAGVVVMPWVPHVREEPTLLRRHVRFGPGDRTLADWCSEIPILRNLAEQRRVKWYNLATAPLDRLRPEAPVTHASAFSAEAILNLFAEAGVARVRSLGIDGGRDYSQNFGDLTKETMVLARNRTYDEQFEGMAKTIMRSNIDFSPLDMETPVKVYVGTEPEQLLALKVLEFSIRQHTSLTVEVLPLYAEVERAGIDIPIPTDPARRPRTPFSFQRFAIPALKGYKGRAIYVDSDMQVFRDMRELWAWPFDGADVLSVAEPAGSGRKPQFSVMVMNCEQLEWNVRELVEFLDAGHWTYEEFLHDMAPAPKISATLPEGWNDLERFSAQRTALLHYTNMETQPWLSTENALARIWCQALADAIEGGFIAREMVDEHIAKQWIRPSLGYQLDHGIVDPLLLPESVKARDAQTFRPPHVRGNYGYRASLQRRVARKLRAAFRDVWLSSGAATLTAKLRRRFLQ